jgi:hypothetical protein
MNFLKPSGSAFGRACGMLTGFSLTLLAGVFVVFAAAAGFEDPAGNILHALPLLIFSLAFLAFGLVITLSGLIPWIAGMRVSRPDIALSTGAVRVGEGFTVQYAQTFRRVSEVKSIRLQLILRERATYRHGKSTSTAVHEETAAEYEFPAKVFQAGEPLSFSRGMEIPRTGMHTFQGFRNRIDWLLRVKVDIAGWPDYREDFEIFVEPAMAG